MSNSFGDLSPTFSVRHYFYIVTGLPEQFDTFAVQFMRRGTGRNKGDRAHFFRHHTGITAYIFTFVFEQFRIICNRWP